MDSRAPHAQAEAFVLQADGDAGCPVTDGDVAVGQTLNEKGMGAGVLLTVGCFVSGEETASGKTTIERGVREGQLTASSG